MVHDGLREMHFSSMKTRRLRGDLSAAFIYLREMYREDGPDFSELFSGRWEAIDAGYNNENSDWILGKNDPRWE